MPAGLNKDHCVVLSDGKFDASSGASAADLQQIFAEFSNQKAPLVVHFHGGLVDKRAGIAGAETLAPIYEGAEAFPIFFVWESGWEEVLQKNLPSIFQEPIFQKILNRVSQFAKGKIDKAATTGMGRGPGRVPVAKETAIRTELDTAKTGSEPFAEVNPRVVPDDDALTTEEMQHFQETLQADPASEDFALEVAASLEPPVPGAAAPRGATVRTSAVTLMDPDVMTEVSVGSEGARSISIAIMVARTTLVLAAVVRRFAQRRDHGFYLTVIEEILRAFYVGNAGRFFWDGMKQDITDSFGVGPDCGGTAFVDGLAALAGGAEKPRITLVGHSAGAIYVCRLLQEVQSRNLSPDLHFNVILIAPACDFTLLAKTLQTAGARIDNLRVFGMGDDLERKDAIVPVVYPSSLLYLVSGVIEKDVDDPLVGMARYYGAPYDNTKTFIDVAYVKACAAFASAHALNWSMCEGGDGFNCDMTSHGGWVDTKATVGSVAHIIQKGYG